MKKMMNQFVKAFRCFRKKLENLKQWGILKQLLHNLPVICVD